MFGIGRARKALQELRVRRAHKAVENFPVVAKRRFPGLPGELIVSLTSYPARFPSLASTIKSLLDQRTQADRTILWVSHEDSARLPSSVIELVESGLIIMETEDTKSYKKILPALARFPDAFIVTADDDVYYAPNWLCELVKKYKAQPIPSIVAWRANLADRNKDGTFIPYELWEISTRHSRAPDASRPIMPTGVGGVLYPPGAFSPLVTSEEYKTLCPHGDDIWLFWMAALKGTPTVRVNKDFHQIAWAETQDGALFHENLYNGRNDTQIRAMEARFGVYPVLMR